MQNKPKLPKARMNLSHYSKETYNDFAPLPTPKNKPKTKPNKPKQTQNKPKSKPNQSQIKANSNPTRLPNSHLPLSPPLLE